MSKMMACTLIVVAAFNSHFPFVRCEDSTPENNMKDPSLWSSIEMPKVSYFAGMGIEAPTDAAAWERAKNNAMTGKQMLLESVSKVVQFPRHVLRNDNRFSRIKSRVDVMLCNYDKFEAFREYNMTRAPLVSFGGHSKTEPCMFGAIELMTYMTKHKKYIDRIIPKDGFIGIGNLDENWGYLSNSSDGLSPNVAFNHVDCSYFMNRTVAWQFHYEANPKPFPKCIPKNGQLESVQPLIGYDRLIMMLVNQHHNISHPKVISLPLGVLLPAAKMIHEASIEALGVKVQISNLMLSASSSWGPRPIITKCVKDNMGSYMKMLKKVTATQYVQNMITSATVLCLPGLGYDTYRLFETLYAGSMPVLERATGLDRSMYRLPVLMLDDFSQITPELIRQAYAEALYHAEKGVWDYRRITQQWWDNLLLDVSISKNIDILMERHPMPLFADNIPFSRPVIPYICPKGGCGKGTDRTPASSCAIDLNTDYDHYHWDWAK